MKKGYPIITLFLALLTAAPLQAALPFLRDFGFTNGCNAGSNSYFYAGAVQSTEFDAIYTEECYFINPQTITLSEPLVAGQTYTMYLHFAEIYYGAGNSQHLLGDGSRVFHVDVEGVRVLENYDIHANVGPRNAHVFKYDFTVGPDGRADLTFTPVINNAKISAVEIVDLGEPSLYPPTTSIVDLNNSAFPVEWAEINAEARGNNAVLTWSTVWETNNAGFEIQMGDLSGGFETVGFVEGAGTTTEPTFYQFTTDQLLGGSYVFRIKQRDFDGKISLSPMMEVAIGDLSGINMKPLQPNPAIEYTLVRFYGHKGDDVRIQVQSLYGQTIREVFDGELPADGQQSFPISTTDLTPGYYFIQLVQEGEISGQRLLVSPR